MKEWKKPVLLTIQAKELGAYIQAAARSGGCSHGDSR